MRPDRVLRLFLGLGLLILAGTVQAEGPGGLRVGVRADAPPFSYKISALADQGSLLASGPLGREGYGGYVVNICDDVLSILETRYGIEIEAVEVNAKTRFVLLNSDIEDRDRNNVLEPSQRTEVIDILCDPATLLGDRLARFTASAPIYMSGITFATFGGGVPPRTPCSSIVGVVAATTSSLAGTQAILQSGPLAIYAETLKEFTNDPSAWREANPEQGSGCTATVASGDGEAPQKLHQPVYYASTHDELAEAFCAGNVLHYVGDIEIVNRQLRNRPNCKFSDGALTFTDERYVIYSRVPDKDDTAKSRSVLLFYDWLARRSYGPNSILLESFSAAFPGYTASRKLQTLYWSLLGTFPGAAR